jgi:hypothetical protein
MSKSSSAERYRLRDSFHAVRAQLLDERYANRLDRSLGYWALPADRRLPVALMNLTLRDILNSTFESLSATPGIGQRKLHTLVDLMRRVQQDLSSDGQASAKPASFLKQPLDLAEADHDPNLDPDVIPEKTWETWCETVKCQGLGDERLGRLAPSLLDLPTVIWEKRLSEYVDLSLQQVRRLKTHGEKRVRVVLDVFRTIHRLLGNVGQHPGFVVRLQPSFLVPIEEWLIAQWYSTEPLTLAELRQHVVLPIINQIALDAGPLIQKLVEGRLGLESPPESVRALGQQNSITRARVYQLLEVCDRVMQVRWPEGRSRFDSIERRLASEGADPEAHLMLQRLLEIMFPLPADHAARRSPVREELADRATSRSSVESVS